MLKHIYCIYNPVVECFDERFTIAPMKPEDMAEQYRRAFLCADETSKKAMEGKQVIYMGTFDDISGEIQKSNKEIIITFEKAKEEKVDGRKD